MKLKSNPSLFFKFDEYAIWVEYPQKEVYQFTGQLVSEHTIKPQKALKKCGALGPRISREMTWVNNTTSYDGSIA